MFIHSIFNKRQTLTYYSIEEILHMIQLNDLQLRETNAPQVSKIRKSIVDNIMNDSIYFPPIVACAHASLT